MTDSIVPGGGGDDVRIAFPPWLKDVAKLGTASAIALYLTWFVTQSMKGLLEQDQRQRAQTAILMQSMTDALKQHQDSSDAGINRLLQTSLVICSNTATDAVQRRACFDDDLAKKLEEYFKQVR